MKMSESTYRQTRRLLFDKSLTYKSSLPLGIMDPRQHFEKAYRDVPSPPGARSRYNGLRSEKPKRIRSLRIWLYPALLLLLACNGDGDSTKDTRPTAPTVGRHASFEMTAQVLGPVEQDDASDLLITIRETGGVDAALHFIRLTCTSGAQQEWGAQSFIDERGSNVIRANSELQVQRSYRCPSSARPSLVTAALTDAGGADHTVETAAVHPDWPG